VRSRVAAVASAVLVFGMAWSAAGQGTVLQYRWTAGQEDRYKVTQKTVATVSGIPGGGTQTVEQSMTQTTVLKVIAAAPDGGATVQQTFEAIRMEMMTPSGPMVFDSSVKDRPSDPTLAGMATMLTGMVGEAITLVLKPNGDVVKVEGMSKLLEKVTAGLSADMAANPAVASLKSTFSDDGMRRTFAQSFGGFPANPIAAGESWTGTSEVVQPVVGTLSTVRTSTLKATENTGGSAVARIALVLAVKQSAEAPDAGLPMKVTIGDAKGTGEVMFDVTKGRVQRSTVEMDMPMTMAMTGPDGQGVTLQNNVHTSVVMELVQR
jgi:hypothetical protein